MCNDFSSGFRDSSLSADSKPTVGIHTGHPEQGNSIAEKKQWISEPERIAEILPGIMADIEKRIERSSCA